MGTHILTLFGEEVVPEQINTVGKRNSVPKKEKKPKKKAAPKTEEKEETIVEEPPVQEERKPDILDGWDGKKQYYSIGEVAKLFEVRTSNIRYWTKEFAIKVRTTRKGDRLYTPDQIKEIRTIYHLVKERGFTINGAKAHLKNNKKAAVEAVDLKESLLHLRNKLVELKNSVK